METKKVKLEWRQENNLGDRDWIDHTVDLPYPEYLALLQGGNYALKCYIENTYYSESALDYRVIECRMYAADY